MQMAKITKPSEAEGFVRVVAGTLPNGKYDLENPAEQLCFTAAECKLIAMAYGDERAKKAEGYQSNAEAWESLFNSQKWGGKDA
jgi:hypothetical protein